MKKTLSLGQMLTLNTYWVGLSFMWNVLHPIVLPAVLLNFVADDRKNTTLGLLTFIGLVIAMIVQPISGALSDGWVSRYGRRRPLIVLGTLMDFVFLALLAWAGGLTWLFVGYIGLQFSSNIAHGPAQGLLPDVTPASQIGAASGLKIFMDMFTTAAATLAAGFLLDPETRDPALVMGLVMGLLFVSTLVTVLGTREAPSDHPARSQTGQSEGDLLARSQTGQSRSEVVGTLARGRAWADLRGQFRVDFRANTAYWWLIAQRFVCLLGIYGIQQFAQYYIQDVLKPENPVRDTGVLMAAIIVALLILAMAGGRLTDRFGPRRVTTAAVLVIAAGCPLMLLGRDLLGLALYGAVFGAGAGLFLTANWAQANRLAPAAEAGKYLGFTNLATAGAGALARLEGPAIDALNAAQPGAWWGYTALFLFGAVCALASLPLLRKVARSGATQGVTG